MRMLTLAVFAFLAAAAAFRQTAPPLVETIEVRVVNVDVVVTDRQGTRITGLTKDDFEVFEKRRKQAITNFSEIGRTTTSTAEVTPEESAAPAHARRRNTIVFFIDAGSIDPTKRHVVFEELRRFAGNVIGPGDRAMVAVWNRSFRIAQPFTESAETIQRVLSSVEKESGGANLLTMRRTTEIRIEDELEAALAGVISMGMAYENSRAHAQSYTEDVFAQVRSLLMAVSSTLGAFAGAKEDKKGLVYVGDYLPMRTGAEMMQHVEDVFSPHITLTGTSLQFESLNMASHIDRVVKAANAGGITAYMISGGALHRVGVDASERQLPEGSMSQTVLEMDTRSTFVATAEQTGGVAFTGGSARRVLRQIEEDFHSYYSIGFRPTGSAGKSRSITVRTKNRDYVVRSRESYVLLTVADEMEDRVVANIYHAEPQGELAMRTEPGVAFAEGRQGRRVPVRVFVQGERITLLPQGGKLTGEVTVFVCAGSTRAGSSKVLRHTQRLNIPASDEARFRASHLTFTFEVIVDQRAGNVISAGVLDAISGSYGTARAPVKTTVTDTTPWFPTR